MNFTWLLSFTRPLGGPALAALVVALAALLGRAVLLRARVRRDAARARRDLGEPRRGLEGLGDGAPVTLAGVLEVVGPPCQRFDDGADVAAATAQGAADPRGITVQAERLLLRLDDRAVEIVGPVE